MIFTTNVPSRVVSNSYGRVIGTANLSLLQLFHGGDDQTLRVLDLLHHEADIHRGELRLALASAIHAVLTDEGERVSENIQSGGETAAHRSHLEVVSFFGLAIMIEQRTSLVTNHTR
jgi:hypothetical protein